MDARIKTWTEQLRPLLDQGTTRKPSVHKMPATATNIPPSIQTEISQFPDTSLNYTFEDNGRTCTFRIYQKKGGTLHINWGLLEAVVRFFTSIAVQSGQANSCGHRPLLITLYLSHAKKQFPKTAGQLIGEDHANTGFTYACNPSAAATQDPTEIVLYRHEEIFKVLIHELIHALGLDFSYDSAGNERAAAIIRQCLGLRIADLRVYETYCEIWACFFKCLFQAVLSSKSGNVSAECMRLFALEQTFAIAQCAKVLNYGGFLITDFFRSHKSVRKGGARKTFKRKVGGDVGTPPGRSHEYRENTQVFCYHILKAALMSDIGELGFPFRAGGDGADAFAQLGCKPRPDFVAAVAAAQRKKKRTDTTLRLTATDVSILI